METDDLYPSSDEESIDGEEIVVEGLRRSRNSTNWQYRGTALTTTDRMDLEDLRMLAIDMETVVAYISAAFTGLAVVAKSRAEQNLPIDRIKKVLDCLCIAVAWITCSLEMTYLDIDDKMYFTHVRRAFDRPKLRTINEILDDNQSEFLFGFKIQELQLLLAHWRIPTAFRQDNAVLKGEESMLIFLHYIRTGTAFTRITHIFGGDPRRYTYHVRAISDHLYNTFYHKISGDSMRMWVDCIDDCRMAIWEKLQDGLVNETSSDGSEVDWEVWIPPEYFRVFGWLDDTDLMTNRPRPARLNESEEIRDTQTAFYKYVTR